MSDWFTENNDWRKQAAMTAVNDLDIEKAVYDQAAGFVENKLTPLMKGDHPLGFEIVKKNDDNTRIVGVFAFKVDKSLLFAPVFFINGEIKGPLLYRCDTKTFVPANKEWAEYLISSGEMLEGKGRDRSRRFENPPLVQMQRIAFLPPSMRKRAAADGTVEEKNKEVPVKTIKVTATKITGKYTVRDMDNAADDKQPETTVGELKVASYDDGTVRMSFNGGAEEFLTAEGADDIKRNKVATVQLGGDGVLLSESATARIKQAFLTNVENPSTAAVYDALLSKAEYLDKPAHLLKDLLADPVYGEASTDVILKVAEANVEFAEQLARLCDGKASELFSPRPVEKKASAVPELSIVYDQELLTKQAAVSKEYFRDGFFIHDTRPEESLSVVYETSPGAISSPDIAGEYAVVTNQGKLEDGIFVAALSPDKMGSEYAERVNTRRYVQPNPIDNGTYRGSADQLEYVLIRDKRAIISRGVMGVAKRDASLCRDILKKDVQAGKCYFVYITNSNVLRGPIVIKSVREADGVKYADGFVASVLMGSGTRRSVMWHSEKEKTMTFNPDVPTNTNDLVFGYDARFIEIELEPSDGDDITLQEALRKPRYSVALDIAELKVDVGSAKSVDNFIFNKFNIPHVKIKQVLFGDEDTTPKFSIEAMGTKSAAMHKVCMMVKLARDLNISAGKVYDIMEKVAANGSHEFYIEGLTKEATQLHLVDSPQFDEKFSTEFGVPIQPTKVYHLRTRGIQMFEPPSSIGDAMNPTTATGLPDLTVTTTAPEDLRALADTYSLPHVFDHAAVGTLADTFNAMALMNKYIPAIEDAVDAIGRIKFLFYWLPEDFEKAYGQDDMLNIEAQVDTQFTALGSLLLKLLKKSDALKKSDGTNEDQKENE